MCVYIALYCFTSLLALSNLHNPVRYDVREGQGYRHAARTGPNVASRSCLGMSRPLYLWQTDFRRQVDIELCSYGLPACLPACLTACLSLRPRFERRQANQGRAGRMESHLVRGFFTREIFTLVLPGQTQR